MKNIYWSLLFFSLAISGCDPGKIDAGTEDLRTTTIIFVRHAEKADDGTNDPGLTSIGEARAQRLATMLAPTGVDGIFSTPYERTRMTAKPLAELTKQEITEYDPENKDFINNLPFEHAGETLLVVGHSNTVPGMVNALIGETTYNNLDEMEYDKLFIVHITRGKGQVIVLSF